MRLSPKALAIVSGLLWGGGLLMVGLVNLADPSYGTSFLHGLSSVYPGFHASRTIPDVFVGTGYGIVDGAVAGWVAAWLYNFVLPRVEKA